MTDGFKEIRHPQTGKVLFRFDARGDRVEIKSEQTGGKPHVEALEPHRAGLKAGRREKRVG